MKLWVLLPWIQEYIGYRNGPLPPDDILKGVAHEFLYWGGGLPIISYFGQSTNICSYIKNILISYRVYRESNVFIANYSNLVPLSVILVCPRGIPIMPPTDISYVPARGIANTPPAGGRCPRTAQNIYLREVHNYAEDF